MGHIENIFTILLVSVLLQSCGLTSLLATDSENSIASTEPNYYPKVTTKLVYASACSEVFDSLAKGLVEKYQLAEFKFNTPAAISKSEGTDNTLFISSSIPDPAAYGVRPNKLENKNRPKARFIEPPSNMLAVSDFVIFKHKNELWSLQQQPWWIYPNFPIFNEHRAEDLEGYIIHSFYEVTQNEFVVFWTNYKQTIVRQYTTDNGEIRAINQSIFDGSPAYTYADFDQIRLVVDGALPGDFSSKAKYEKIVEMLQSDLKVDGLYSIPATEMEIIQSAALNDAQKFADTDWFSESCNDILIPSDGAPSYSLYRIISLDSKRLGVKSTVNIAGFGRQVEDVGTHILIKGSSYLVEPIDPYYPESIAIIDARATSVRYHGLIVSKADIIGDPVKTNSTNSIITIEPSADGSYKYNIREYDLGDLTTTNIIGFTDSSNKIQTTGNKTWQISDDYQLQIFSSSDEANVENYSRNSFELGQNTILADLSSKSIAISFELTPGHGSLFSRPYNCGYYGCASADEVATTTIDNFDLDTQFEILNIRYYRSDHNRYIFAYDLISYPSIYDPNETIEGTIETRLGEVAWYSENGITIYDYELGTISISPLEMIKGTENFQIITDRVFVNNPYIPLIIDYESESQTMGYLSGELYVNNTHLMAELYHEGKTVYGIYSFSTGETLPTLYSSKLTATFSEPITYQ